MIMVYSALSHATLCAAEIVYDLVTYVPASPRMHLMPDVLTVNGYLRGLRTHVRAAPRGICLHVASRLLTLIASFRLLCASFLILFVSALGALP